ncbi:DJ-1/PfpI family protein [Plenodomus tracheiphilus IPT5]|uniref:DJ-1/PfpI family protein n=1 Tax=Plenodomus tracheiphilus IPT5 TaxID=1408161 RepID=A0A6A7B007_9PLEO|nr:DJ-1/PfpI family protein [Plenodomus tracheiphilus IPT5]
MHTLPLLPVLSLLATTTHALKLPIPTQPPISNTTTLPTHYALLLFPHFQALDVFGPLDILNTLSMLYANSTTMKLSVLARTMEPVSTAMQGKGGLGFGQSVLPTGRMDGYLQRTGGKGDDGEGDIEVLIVPGGGGTRGDVEEEIEFVGRVYPGLHSIISICTGATLLSRSSILNSHRATTNKRAWSWATSPSTNPSPPVDNITWVPTARWVEDGNIWTSSGISAGIDVMYAWVASVYGEEVAEYVALVSEYERERDAGNDGFGVVWGVPGAE